jgi:hypothetical protein
VQKNRSIKPKIRWKAKGLPDVWQGQHQVLEVQQALIGVSNWFKNAQKTPKNCGFSGFFHFTSSVAVCLFLAGFELL